jgi:ubiquinone/menaquinone biosynthesis C-methylase UbiE
MPSRDSARGRIAYSLCQGFGLEIGALHDPFELDATVLYLDFLSTRMLRERYRRDQRGAFVQRVDIIARKPPYAFFDDEVFDFVIGSHVLEHMPNPGLALKEWTRIVRKGGIVYNIIPNKEKTFDRGRRETDLDTLLSAYHANCAEAPLAQYQDYFLNKILERGEKRKSPEDIVDRWRQQDSIHVYTYTPRSARAFLEALGREIGFELVHFHTDGIDIHFACRRNGPTDAGQGRRRVGTLQAQVSELQRQLSELRAYGAELERRHAAVLRSSTWRALEPIRWIARRMRGKPAPAPFSPRLAGRHRRGATPP